MSKVTKASEHEPSSVDAHIHEITWQAIADAKGRIGSVCLGFAVLVPWVSESFPFVHTLAISCVAMFLLFWITRPLSGAQRQMHEKLGDAIELPNKLQLSLIPVCFMIALALVLQWK